MSHIPVLLKEVINLLDVSPGKTFIDGTAGGGGHAKEIFDGIGGSGKLLLVDWDKNNVERLKEMFSGQKNVFCVLGNYGNLPELMRVNNFPKADCLLLDLGFSSDQLENGGRGFSFLKDEPLIMTYSDDSEPLKDFLKRAKLAELIKIIRDFGEESYAQKVAEAIFKNKRQIFTSRQLAEIVAGALPKSYERGRIHPATRTFQAFRIFINQELENLSGVLESLFEILKPGGRVAIISFHSLEDRIVKNCFKILEKKGRLKILTKKPIFASLEEVAKNPRSRSAKLRAAEII